ncbi:hypothetical protein DFR58_108123 [Anaerobacterium chartisolvens]|uniref:DUF4044 domain-containing protein n=1 Tax=Anaerobacterium chartisolvens TaxID=1297424 RepID=A0A369B9G2_9FIRM|nr:hypothetical protein DFR58_108123 [Anaerobacterium chartisolvens]
MNRRFVRIIALVTLLVFFITSLGLIGLSFFMER